MSSNKNLLDLLVNVNYNEEEESHDIPLETNTKQNTNINSTALANDNLNDLAKASDNDNITLLESMGFEKKLIETVYANMQPVDLQEALDLLSTNAEGKFTHSYIANDKYLCTICSRARTEHENQSTYLSTLNKNYVIQPKLFIGIRSLLEKIMEGHILISAM